VFYNTDVCGLSDAALFADFSRWARAGFRRNVAPGEVTLCAHPFLMDAATKRRVLQLEAVTAMNAAAQSAVMAAHPLFGGGESPYLVLQVRRAHAVRDALVQLSRARDGDLRKQLKVVFVGEEGLDAGGVTKDFFQLVFRSLLGPDTLAGLFTATDGRVLYFTPEVPAELAEEYYLVGVLLGLAIYNSVTCPHEVRFPLALYHFLQGKPHGWADFAEVFPGLARGLAQLLEYDGDADAEDVFCLSWEATVTRFGEPAAVELEPGGSARAVTSADRAAYVAALMDFHMRRAVAGGAEQFRRGFQRVLATPTMQLFSPAELRLLVEGEHTLDFGALQGAAVYEGGYDAEHSAVKAFWRVARELPAEDKRALLLFVTGSNQSPIGGLGKLAIKVQRMTADTEGLPTAATCFNTLLLPEYSSEAKMKRKLLQAIRECSGFGLQ
jgi:hypothetical protein